MDKVYRILSLFDCPLKDAKILLPSIREQGFNVVQISPLQKCKTSDNNEWWLLYQPLGFEIGNKIGNKEELMDLCQVAKDFGIYIIVDAVINHVGNKSDEEPLIPHPDTDIELLNGNDCFKMPIQITDWDDRKQVINYCLGLPGLNPNSSIVQRKVSEMLNEFIELGVDGFRFDAAKSIALPEDEDSCNFFPIVNYSLKKWLPLVYGEVLFASEELINKYAKYMKVLTNSYSSNIESVIKFVENKDTFLSKDLGYTRFWPVERIVDEYIDLATRYPNTLFYARNYTDDWYAWQSSDVKKANKQYVRRY